jgi:type I restriction enzyme M protein
MSQTHQEHIQFIWNIAEKLRGPYRPPQYRKVMIPMTVLRRLDCVLAPTKDKVLEQFKTLKGGKLQNIEPILQRVAGQKFYNTSKLDFEKLLGDPANIAANLVSYMTSFSPSALAILKHFNFEDELEKLESANRLFMVVKDFAAIDLHPSRVSNIEMGYIFEALVHKFNEQANEEAGDHFTPREVIRLMVHLLFDPDDDTLTKKGIVRTIYDPACGTGGMLSIADEYIHEHNPQANLALFGQEYNSESYAVCGSDMLIKGEDVQNIAFGDTLGDGKTRDGHPDKKFHYMLSNPPFGVEWKPEENVVRKEYETQGFNGRFGAGLPRISDGSFLFLQHMISKFHKPPADGGDGSRLAIVFNGSPLFAGDAGSGESNIRKWIIENDWLEAIIALPDQMFYNTGIFTYLWVVTNRKVEARKGKVQLINATNLYQKMKKSLGNKRNELSAAHIDTIAKIYGEFADAENSKTFRNQDFGYLKITVERPLKLSFQVTPERIEILKAHSAFEALATSKKLKDKKAIAAEIAAGEKLQSDILLALDRSHGFKPVATKGVWKNRDTFKADLEAVLEAAKLSLPAPVMKAIMSSLSERDETADLCVDRHGKPEPDTDLRDTEIVPLPDGSKLPINDDDLPDFKAHCEDYLKREVLPHVPDAWIDHTKTKVGYEIPFNRYFYKYESPRPLKEIESEIKAIEQEIMKMLSEVTT